MTLVADRFVITTIVRELDTDGTVLSERQAEPVTVFGVEALTKWAGEFPEMLSKSTEQP